MTECVERVALYLSREALAANAVSHFFPRLTGWLLNRLAYFGAT